MPMPKMCATCAATIVEPVLGDEEREQCPLCGDEPATTAEVLAIARRVADQLARLLHYVEGGGQRWEEAHDGFDTACDGIDSAIRTLESDDLYSDEDEPGHLRDENAA